MKKMLNVVLMLGFVVFYAASPVAAALISFNPSSPVVTEGTLVTVDVLISGLVDGAAPSLGAFDLDVTFDPAILGFNTVSFGDPSLGDQLDLSGSGALVDFNASTPGSVNLFELSLDTADVLNNLQADTFLLFSLTFDTLGEGISVLGFANVVLGDAVGDPLEAVVEAGLVTVTPETTVPVPSALLLFGSGLIGGSLLKRRRTRE